MQEKHETLDITPRDYCLCYTGHAGAKIYFTPVNAAKANLMIRNPGEIALRTRATQRYKADSQETGAYDPVFLWTEKDLGDEDPYKALREGVKKHEGYYKLLDTTRKEAVNAAVLRGNVLSGIVASKKLRQITTSTEYIQIIKGVHLDRNGHIAWTDVNCNCPDHVYDTAKGAEPNSRMLCVHSHALLNYYVGWLSSMIEVSEKLRFEPEFPAMHVTGIPRAHPFDPFMFSSNWRNFDRRTGRFWPSKRSLASLEYEIPWEYYVHGLRNFSINSTLLHNHNVMAELFSDPLLDGISRGEVVFEIVRQKPEKESISKAESARQSALYSAVFHELDRHGYKHNGYCMEMGRPARRFESNSFVIDLAMDDGLLYYICRKKTKAKPDLSLQGNDDSLAAQLSIEQQCLDDRTRIVTPTYVGIPTKLLIREEGRFVNIPVPDEMRRRYRKIVEERSTKPTTDKKKFGLE